MTQNKTPGESTPEILTDIIKVLHHPFITIHKVINTSISVLIVIGGIAVGYGLHKSNQLAEHNNNQIEILNKYYVTQNQQTILLKIIDENLRDSNTARLGSASLEEKVAVAKIWYDLCSTKKVPLSLLAGIADTESKWNTHAVSPSGCVGLLQTNPLYSRAYLRENRIDYRKDIYFDPVVDSICGIGALSDFQNVEIEAGLATPDNFNFATRDYFWGPSKRGNIFDMNYSLKVITAMKQFQLKGLM